MNDYAEYSDEALIQGMRTAGHREAAAMREVLYARIYPTIGRWCLSLCHDRDTAADLAQDVVERVHQRLDTFRLESRFSTWVYTVTRRTAINRLKSEQRHHRRRVATDAVAEPVDDTPGAAEMVSREEMGARLRDVIDRRLEPLEAQVVYLHYVDGLTLPAITEMLGLTNKSGSKAFLVGGMRKLRKHLGPWLERQFAVEGR